MLALWTLVGLSAGLSARPPAFGDNAPAMRPRQTLGQTPVTSARPVAAAGLFSGENAAKQDVNAGPVPPSPAASVKARPPAAGRPAGAPYQYKAAWSKYASSAGNGNFAPRRGGTPLPAVRSKAVPVEAPNPAAVPPRVSGLPAGSPISPAGVPPRQLDLPAPTPVEMPAAVAEPTAEDAAKAAWLAKQDAPKWGAPEAEGPMTVPVAAPTAAAAAAAPPQRTPAAVRPEGAPYQYQAAWSKYASSAGNGEFAPRRGQ